MIARRITTALLFILFFMILELNQNTFWGWILLAVLTLGFVVLFESGVMKGRAFLKVLAWVGYFALFAGIILLTYPPYKRIPADLSDNITETGIIELKDGRVTGILDKDTGVETYAGIPYAAPPVGELRWKEPQDPEPWSGVLKADRFAPMSMQQTNLPIYNSLTRIVGYHDYRWFDLSDNYREEVSEDSLYVNVWKPEGEVKNLPVLVYIHGGSLQTGHPSYSDYRGENLAKEGVIVVNMGYRLGVFGYLALEELAGESKNGTTGNYGLLDQIKALEWVRDNISVFGGDPSNVTVAGESAGAASVSALCTSPLAKGLFRRVILESSTVASKIPPHSYRQLDDALKSGRVFKEKTGADTLEELRALPADKIVSFAQSEHHITVDGYALTEDPFVSYSKGVFNEEAALHGFNREESAPFILFSGANMKNYEQKVRAYYGKYADEILNLYPAENDKQAAGYWAEIYGAEFFDYPHFVYNRVAVNNSIPVYEYYFSKDNKSLGSWHSGELIYAYRNIPEDSKLYDERDREVMRVFSSFYLNFIKTGDPNGENLPRFEQNKDGKTYFELGDNIGQITENERKLALFGIYDRMQDSGK